MKSQPSQERFKVGLFSLPLYNSVYMQPALGYLTGQLRKEVPDAEVVQRDLNVDSLEYFLGRALIEKMRDPATLHDFDAYVQYRKEISDLIAARTNGSIRIERNSFTYDLEKTEEDSTSRQGLLDIITNKERNVYFKYFRDVVLPYIEEQGLDLVGLSVCSQKQLATAFLLSSMIKEKYGEEVKVVIGGNVITRGYDVLSNDDELNRQLLQHVDYLVHHEGEVPIAQLVSALMKGEDVEGVSKLIYMKDSKVTENLEFVIEHLSNISAPDYSDMIAQQQHWTPNPVIPYLITRGCDWGACRFCDIPAGYDGSAARIEEMVGKKFLIERRQEGLARRKNLDEVVSELKKLNARYDTKYFSFGDEEIRGHLLSEFVDKLLEEQERTGFRIEWEMYGRIEEQYLNYAFCERLARAGCMFVQLGVETASQEILDKSNKGYESSMAGQVLKNVYEAGMMTHSFFLVGLPGDSLVASSKTMRFLQEYGKYLTTIKPIHYKVSKLSPNALHPEVAGIQLDRESTPDLDVNINLGAVSGLMSRHKAKDLVRVIDLWVRQYHPVNPATSQYIYAQRFFLTRDELEEFGRSVNPIVDLCKEDEAAIGSVYNGLKEEVKQLAYATETPKEKRRKFEMLYRRLKGQQKPSTLDEVLSLMETVADIEQAA